MEVKEYLKTGVKKSVLQNFIKKLEETIRNNEYTIDSLCSDIVNHRVIQEAVEGDIQRIYVINNEAEQRIIYLKSKLSELEGSK